ncbi:MAG TPA: lytic murein transglycosylase B [Legionellaceae bacterium]|nr:lytic murein transglycosylase B [Legionellaceae bacterium]
MRNWLQRVIVSTMMVIIVNAYADAALVHQKNVQLFIRDLVQRDHFDHQQLQRILAAAKYQPQIIASMERPFEKKNWDVDQALFLTQERLQSGLNFWRNNHATLQKVEQEYGVPPEMIVAILGVETLYGKHQGTYRVLDALSTLAFYYPPRAEYFKRELREFLLLCREHGVSATAYKGSYAGAMGKPQFMPSSYRTYAVNYQGLGRPNLMNHDADVIVSVANYFKKHGWKSHQMVAEKVRPPLKNAHRFDFNAKTPNYTFTQLLQAGIQPQMPSKAYPKEVGLLELITEAGPEYWMAYPNFYVITRYNSSPQYALAVYLLAQSLRESHT